MNDAGVKSSFQKALFKAQARYHYFAWIVGETRVVIIHLDSS